MVRKNTWLNEEINQRKTAAKKRRNTWNRDGEPLLKYLIYVSHLLIFQRCRWSSHLNNKNATTVRSVTKNTRHLELPWQRQRRPWKCHVASPCLPSFFRLLHLRTTFSVFTVAFTVCLLTKRPTILTITVIYLFLALFFSTLASFNSNNNFSSYYSVHTVYGTVSCVCIVNQD